MYAVVRTGGKQYRVSPGDTLEVELLAGESGSSVEFDEVLLVGDGDKVEVGQPLVSGAQVAGEIVDQIRGPKQIIFKKIRRHGHRKKKGHRQELTRVKIKDIVRN